MLFLMGLFLEATAILHLKRFKIKHIQIRMPEYDLAKRLHDIQMESCNKI